MTGVSSTKLTVKSPSHAAGQVDVRVVTAGGESAIVAADHYTYATTPAITGIVPSEGPSAGGNTVEITGTNLGSATKVKFGANEVIPAFIENTATKIKVAAPSHAAGQVDVRVVTAGGESAIVAADHYTYRDAPTVGSVVPNHGTTAGGTLVTVLGTNLSAASKVEFGATAVACPKVGAPGKCVLKNSTEIEVETPANAAGTVDVKVTTAGGTSATSALDHFTFETPSVPIVASVSPNEGPTAGGQVVTITGTNLSAATEVEYGGEAVTCAGTIATCLVESATKIKATTPAHVAGTVDVTVTTPGGTSATSAADEYTFAEAPTVTALSLSQGPPNAEVTITGTSLGGATEVHFGAEEANGFTVDSATTIKAHSPLGCTTGTVDVTVTTPGGTSATSVADEFTCEASALPEVTAISPSIGPTVGGEVMTITGTNLIGVETVEFGSRAVACEGSTATCVAESPTQLAVTIPEHAAGTFHVTVTSPGGTSAPSPADEYTFVASPAVTAVSPAQGPTAGGATVTITGLHLGGATAVQFGSTEAAIVENTETAIKATAPAQAAGAVHVRVTTIGGTSGKFAADEYTYVGPQALTVSIAGTGSGSVSCNGGACASSYPFGSSVTLAATPAADSTFAGFSGACSGTGSCAVTIEGPVAVTATFESSPNRRRSNRRAKGPRRFPRAPKSAARRPC